MSALINPATNASQSSPRDYARAGRLGIGTPQANPTVEAEIRRLLPYDVDAVTLRLTSPSADPTVRLKGYLTDLPHHAKQFAGMQIDVFCSPARPPAISWTLPPRSRLSPRLKLSWGPR